ncbi:leucine-rich repeat domain-containing protein [Candidatus Palauibacter sp.]|uniref:leucine-rich repeat domain-containing protein n=1 Tax=Candidatus Palauibacter sp. TaxID=3101350 RepID=UPI003AF26ABB
MVGRTAPSVVVLCLIAVLSCGEDATTGPPPPPPPPPAPPRPATITVTPREIQLTAIGQTAQLGAEIRDQDGRVIPGATVAWASSDQAVAEVDSTGLVTATGEGATTITASAGAVSAAAGVTVTQEVSTLTVSPETVTLRAIGDTARLRADPADANGNTVVGATVLWRSGDQAVAEVDSTGLVTATGEGATMITASAGAVSATAEITVTQEVSTITVSPETVTLRAVGDTARLLADPTDANGNTVASATVLWRSGDEAVAEVDSTGLVRATGEGATTITASAGAVSATARVRVGTSDRATLAAFFHAADGPNWKDNSGWLTEAPLGEWHGVRVDHEGRVVELRLFDNGLAGVLPPEVGSLSHLQYLDVRVNGLRGIIPPTLSNLANLRVLRLSANSLAGTIPPEIGKLSRLTMLTLNGNHLTGAIPRETGKLARLKTLVLDRNRLSGFVPPELGDLSALSELELSYNVLDGPIPPSLLRLGRLTRFLFQGNQGLCVPGTARFTAWLDRISEHRGRFCNESDATVLEQLYYDTGGADWAMSDGWLGGQPLSAWYGVETDSIGRVRRLDLSRNGLTGQLPSPLSQLAALTELRIAGNALSGPLPLALIALSLREFDYSETELCAPPEPSFLEWLNAIPHHQGTDLDCSPLSDHAVLRALYEATNGDSWRARARQGWLTDAPLGSWFGVDADEEGRVTGLGLESSNLVGRIPDEVGFLSELESLRLEGNALTGPIPPTLGQLPKLSHLHLSFNDLRGGIPPELGNLSALRSLRLQSNRSLGGRIPPELGDLATLEELDLTTTGVTGDIPDEIGNLVGLQRLSLYGNALTGRIPPELGALSSLRGLYLFDNVLIGGIPPELGKLEALEHLAIHRNHLTGTIPPGLGNLSNLTQLRLHSNRISGVIPAALGKLSRLSSLGLGNNKLTGAIPREIGNLTNLEILRLDLNELTGGIPRELGRLTRLQTLELTHNAGMRGPLPASLTAIEGLDRLLLGGTQLCAPQEPTFRDWLRGIELHRVARCGSDEGSIAYLTQAVQSNDFPVPLVAGESALLRVFVRASSTTRARIPPVRASFYVGDTETYVVNIPTGSAAIPTEIDEGDLAQSANAEIPASEIRPGLEMVVEIDPGATLDPGLGVQSRIPATGRLELDVREVPPFALTVIPFLLESEPDSSLLDLTKGLNAESELLWDLGSLLPIRDLAVDVHEAVSATSVEPGEVLQMTEAIRVLEDAGGYYLGLVPPSAPGAVRGIAKLGGRSQASRPIPSVIAHEAGHNLNLLHAPCGGAAGPDLSFPHRDGRIGVWGVDPRTNALVSPRTGALMSYCSPRWVSEYNFNKMVVYRLAAGRGAAHAGSSPTKSILLWGGVDNAGNPFLDPAFVVEAPTVLPPPGGAYRLTGATADGDELFSLNFDMAVTADGDGSSSFVFAVPVQPGWAGALANITLSGPEGSATLDGESDRPMAILLDSLSGRVRGIFRDPAARTSADAAGAFSQARHLRMLFSRGLPDELAWGR